MKQLAVLLMLGSASAAFALVPVFDDPHPSNGFEVHAHALLDYGFHNNTYNLKRYFLRADYGERFGGTLLQLFAAVDGYKDTHWPASNYTLLLPTMNLWDGGMSAYFDLPRGLKYFVSLRAGAVYRADWSSLLWVPAIQDTNDVAQWEEPGIYDSPVQYIQDFFQAPGLRTGFAGSGLLGGDWEIGYSQADYRHNIPMAVRAFWTNQAFEFRALSQMHYRNAETFDPTNWTGMGQVSGLLRLEFEPLTLGFHLDVSGWLDGRAHFQAEESVRCAWLTIAARQIACTWAPALFEGEIYWSAGGWKKDRPTNGGLPFTGNGDIVSVGLHGATDGSVHRLYLGSLIDF